MPNNINEQIESIKAASSPGNLSIHDHKIVGDPRELALKSKNQRMKNESANKVNDKYFKLLTRGAIFLFILGAAAIIIIGIANSF